jgi:hypothetical protein
MSVPVPGGGVVAVGLGAWLGAWLGVALVVGLGLGRGFLPGLGESGLLAAGFVSATGRASLAEPSPDRSTRATATPPPRTRTTIAPTPTIRARAGMPRFAVRRTVPPFATELPGVGVTWCRRRQPTRAAAGRCHVHSARVEPGPERDHTRRRAVRAAAEARLIMVAATTNGTKIVADVARPRQHRRNRSWRDRNVAQEKRSTVTGISPCSRTCVVRRRSSGPTAAPRLPATTRARWSASVRMSRLTVAELVQH